MTNLFEYKLVGTGWAEATFISDTETISFEISYLGDPLSDLYEGLCRLLNNKTDVEKIIFPEEPGEHSLVLTRQEDATLKIEIFWSNEWEAFDKAPQIDSTKELVYSDVDTITGFSFLVCYGTLNMLEKMTMTEYSEKWSRYKFPVESFKQLEKIVDSLIGR